jgi:hypothetical protein
MGKWDIDHEDIEGVVVHAETGKPLTLELGDGKVTLTVKQAKALCRIINTGVRKVDAEVKTGAVHLAARKPKDEAASK